jgi:hypothetical protein
MSNISSIPITLRLIRKEKGAKNDDIIKIKCWDIEEDEKYQINYKDGDADTCCGVINHSSTFLTGEQVDTYLISLCTLLTRDSDPFESLQIAAPGFPCILLPVQELKKERLRQAILDVLPILCNFWKV